MSLTRTLNSIFKLTMASNHHTFLLHRTCLVSCTFNHQQQQQFSPQVIQSRSLHLSGECYAARKGKRIAANRAKLARSKARKEEEKLKGPKVWKPAHLMIDRSKLNVGPRRFSDEERRELSEIVDDVYVVDNYKERPYSLDEIIDMHRETHAPNIYNEPEALVEARIEMDLKLKKKNRYMDAFSGILKFPNDFNYGIKRKVIAICKKEEDKEAAKESGAEVVGGAEIVRMFKVGDIRVEDFNDLVCHGDMLVELANIRGLLGKHFPNKLRGNLGFDMKRLVHNFVNGLEYKCVKDEFELDYGWVEMPFGRLDMNLDTLVENLSYLLSQVDKHASYSQTLGPLITRVVIKSAPSTEQFKLKHWLYLDGYQDPDAPQMEDEDEEEDGEKADKQ